MNDKAMQNTALSPNIARTPDGKYRWAYDLSLWKNPTILFMMWKIFGFIFIGIWAFLLIIDLDDITERFWDITVVFFWLILFMFGLIVVSYAVYALIMGGKYCVLFEMDEAGVKHTQMPRQFKKVQVVGIITALLGAAAKNPSATGLGLMTASRQSMTSSFAGVKSIKAYPRRGVIKVNETLNKNQVYADKEDFAAVLDYIVKHCPQAKMKGWSR